MVKKYIIEFKPLMKEWSWERNRDIDPSKTTHGTRKKVWWKCKNNHEWCTSIYVRAINGSGCPYCSNHKVCKDNCLANKFPNISKEWDYNKNCLTPNDFTYGSDKRVWWLCEKGHGWENSISCRTNGEHGCPYCANQKVCDDNSLTTTHPGLYRDWNFSKNNGLTPDNVISGSDKKVWWVCNKGHEWSTSICNRSIKGTGCPYCSGNRVCKENSLSTMFPNIVIEWNYNRNDSVPDDFVSKSHKKVWWVCKRGHEWDSIISNRTGTNKRGCPYCSNQKMCEDNCLATKLPDLAKEWHPTKNENLTPNDVTSSAAAKAWWKCESGHEWEATINSRASGNGCARCSRGRVSLISQRWLDGLNIPENCREKCIILNNGSKIFADALHSNIIYEFHGCFWHGCPKCHPFGMNTIVKKSFKRLYKETKLKEDMIEKSGFKLITMWEGNYRDCNQ